ncbi:glycoside hydrolase family 16 protein [Solwaraspora sp. WMMB335]|uniref:glycoside hydrolase family 16 protein n=1 Tax=Solwaraspora sp. WMMB335 TaxID=3404118 RepID=UPI003B9352FF
MTAGARRGPRRRRAVAATVTVVLTVAALLTAAGWAVVDRFGSPARDWASVSGEPPPGDDLPGWKLVFTDDFGRQELGTDFTAYSGSPGGDTYSTWHPDHVGVRAGTLVLQGYRRDGTWTTGGVSNWPVSQVYGRWEVRFRADPSDEVTYHFLLWPRSDRWPPEIDFAEDFGGPRTGLSAFLHYRSEAGRQKARRDLTGVDFTQWHTVGVEWQPGQVRYLLDGEIWATIESAEVPDEPMWLALQAQSGGCERSREYGLAACPRVGTPDYAEIVVDWVAVYARR